jgi:hypothetical protein
MKLSKKTATRGAVVAGVLGVVLAIYCVYITFFAGIAGGPCFVDELRAGAITSADIAKVEILEFNVQEGWPLKEQDYARMPRKQITSRETIEKLLRIVKDRTVQVRPRGRKHPQVDYFGILRLELVDGEYYYLYYQLAYYDGAYYTYVDANTRGSTNPNGATHFENSALAEFLREHDPAYRRTVVR